MNHKNMMRLINLWPPYIGAGIRVIEIHPDYTSITVRMKLRFWNKNYIGTHFGGSLYAMTDPFYVLMLIHLLGSNYIIWDKSASIRFVKPGVGTVYANFMITEEQLEQIRETLEEEGKAEPIFHIDICDENSAVVASVEKVIYIKKKR